MKYTNIIFDVDGTLLDTRKAVLLSWQEALKANGFNMTEAELNFVLGIPGTVVLKQLGVKNPSAVMAVLDEAYVNYAKYTSVFDGIKETLVTLQAKGINIGLVTSRTVEEYKIGFEPFGLSGYFNIAICADHTLLHKPYSEPMLKYLELAKAQAAKSLYIGDTIYDRDCAHGAGVDFGLALWGAVADIKSEYNFKEPKDILGIL